MEKPHACIVFYFDVICVQYAVSTARLQKLATSSNSASTKYHYRHVHRNNNNNNNKNCGALATPGIPICTCIVKLSREVPLEPASCTVTTCGNETVSQGQPVRQTSTQTLSKYMTQNIISKYSMSGLYLCRSHLDECETN